MSTKSLSAVFTGALLALAVVAAPAPIAAQEPRIIA